MGKNSSADWDKNHLEISASMGLSIKYVTLFLANFDPLPLSHFVTHPGTPQKYITHLGPPIFSRPSTKSPDKSPCTNSFSIVCRGFCQRVFVWKVLSWVVFIYSPFCQNTSVITES